MHFAHVTGTPDARFLIEELGCYLELSVQLNVYRLVVVYRILAQGSLDSAALQPQFARWAIGATDAGWKIGWRDAMNSSSAVTRAIEVYCYASLPVDFLENEYHQLYWITDVVQMTRSFLIEGKTCWRRTPAPRGEWPLIRPGGQGRFAAARARRTAASKSSGKKHRFAAGAHCGDGSVAQRPRVVAAHRIPHRPLHCLEWAGIRRRRRRSLRSSLDRATGRAGQAAVGAAEQAADRRGH